MSLDQPNAFVKHHSVTRDAFLGNRLTLSQPRNGFRAGLDSVLLGAAVCPDSTSLLDLGSGVGTASFVALAHYADLQALLVERDPEIAALARDNAVANGFAARAQVAVGDVTGPAAARREAGMAENAYASVIANPPFFAQGAGTLAAHAGRAGARHMEEAALDHWIRTAAGAAQAGGEVIFVYPAAGLAALLAGFEKRFGAIAILPLLPRPGAAAGRVLMRGIKGSRAPLTLLAGRALHEEEGREFQPEFDAIFRGESRLMW
ncbi:MAG: hypothetical protein ABS76_18655 [Pelagibacterium sp. SCN 64-44]|nr:MAG: hypothetical protein ABS76_18655 [Pelagibacterium sp. SCN 64-44]